MMIEDNETKIQDDVENHSKLFIILENLRNMFDCYLKMVSKKAKEVWMLAFSIEVALVTMKLRALRERWKVYQPFQEVIDVHFGKLLILVES